jgi:hypothetical protein
MCKTPGKYKARLTAVIFLILLFPFDVVFSQTDRKSPVNNIPQRVIFNLRKKIPQFAIDTLSGKVSSLKPPTRPKGKDDLFFDSLKVKAEKHPLTRRLFNFLVVNPDTIYKKGFSRTSDINYIKYSGKKIRKIEIRRLNIFGSDINYPLSDNAKNYEKVLNKTHFNTTENIIRKNLLFRVGDRISPIVLSDNERFLRQLPFIGDARIMVVPVSDEEADIVVFTKDIYSLGAAYTYRGLKKGSISVFDKNILGIGHEFGIDVPYDNNAPHSPGLGAHYVADNLYKTFINLNVFYLYGLGSQTYGFALNRNLISSSTKYAGGISIRHTYTTVDLSPIPVPVPYKYNFQDYWLSRSFLLNSQSVSRFILGTRYTNNNVFDHPVILPDSYYNLQKYKIFLASAALSIQKYTKTNLLYSYGRTEDIPYGALFKATVGREYNEFKLRTYLGGEASAGNKIGDAGYFYLYTGFSTYINKDYTEQGILSLRFNYFSDLLNLGNSRMRNFLYVNYTRGFGRYSNEFLKFRNENGFSGFRNDSVIGNQRFRVSLESVLFSRVKLYGFRCAFFGFTDFAFLAGTNEILGRGYALSSIGLGIRLRNDNLIFNTLQIRIAYFPNPPSYSRISNITLSGEQLLQPNNFDPGPPTIIPYQ